jgi:hypothetical protein
VIFLVNRLGEVNSIAAPFLQTLNREHLELLYVSCAWCTTWSAASELARKRKRALEVLKAR